jgi:hypothetical protein
VWALFQATQWVTVTTHEGCWLAVIESVKEDSGKIIIKILVSEKLSG